MSEKKMIHTSFANYFFLVQKSDYGLVLKLYKQYKKKVRFISFHS